MYALLSVWGVTLINRVRYGLGTCYLRMSKIRMAEYHYRKAAEIHPNNAVLLGCVGMVSFFEHVTRALERFALMVVCSFSRLSNAEEIAREHWHSSMKQSSFRLRTHWCAIGERKCLSA